MVLTKKDIESLKDVFATKKDLESMKKDLESMKKDLGSMKKDLGSMKDVFATKDELQKKIDLVLDSQRDIKKDLQQQINEVKRDLGSLLTGQDKIINELEKAREDRVFAIAKDREQDRRLDSVENRVKALETSNT